MIEKPQAIAAMSGGVDSTVAAKMAQDEYEVIPVIIDHGFMREGEVQQVRKTLQDAGFELPWVWNAEEYFLDEIASETDAEKKRHAFKHAYFGCLSEACREMHVQHLIQGTIAPDWIESQGGIKTHHNVTKEVGIDPFEKYGIEIVEPIRNLYKDEVRQQAIKLDLPPEIFTRQPFPGPGLMLRCVGFKITHARMDLIRKATVIVENELVNYGFGQYFVAIVAPDAQVTGVKGDVRSYGKMTVAVDAQYDVPENWERLSSLITADQDINRVVVPVITDRFGVQAVIRAVKTRDFMTADVGQIPALVLKKVADQLIEINEIGNVYYDITPKPPGTVEFE